MQWTLPFRNAKKPTYPATRVTLINKNNAEPTWRMQRFCTKHGTPGRSWWMVGLSSTVAFYIASCHIAQTHFRCFCEQRKYVKRIRTIRRFSGENMAYDPTRSLSDFPGEYTFTTKTGPGAEGYAPQQLTAPSRTPTPPPSRIAPSGSGKSRGSGPDSYVDAVLGRSVAY